MLDICICMILLLGESCILCINTFLPSMYYSFFQESNHSKLLQDLLFFMLRNLELWATDTDLAIVCLLMLCSRQRNKWLGAEQYVMVDRRLTKLSIVVTRDNFRSKDSLVPQKLSFDIKVVDLTKLLGLRKKSALTSTCSLPCHAPKPFVSERKSLRTLSPFDRK